MKPEVKEILDKWNNGEINEVDNYNEYEETWKSIEYYPDLNVTIFFSHIFEGYYDGDINIFDGIVPGKAYIEEDLREWYNDYEDKN